MNKECLGEKKIVNFARSNPGLLNKEGGYNPYHIQPITQIELGFNTPENARFFDETLDKFNNFVYGGDSSEKNVVGKIKRVLIKDDENRKMIFGVRVFNNPKIFHVEIGVGENLELVNFYFKKDKKTGDRVLKIYVVGRCRDKSEGIERRMEVSSDIFLKIIKAIEKK